MGDGQMVGLTDGYKQHIYIFYSHFRYVSIQKNTNKDNPVYFTTNAMGLVDPKMNTYRSIHCHNSEFCACL